MSGELRVGSEVLCAKERRGVGEEKNNSLLSLNTEYASFTSLKAANDSSSLLPEEATSG